MKNTLQFVLVGACFFIIGTALGQSTMEDGAFNKRTGEQISVDQWKSLLPERFDLFAGDRPLEIALETDFKQFNRDKFKGKKQDALLHFPLNDSVTVRRVIRIEPRGQFRRKYCTPPPIKLNFKKTEFFVDKVQDLDKMKMVSSCKKGKLNQEYVLKEHLTYQLYNLFTDLSFNARLVHIDFIDTGGKSPKSNKGYAFLIEEVDDIEKRNDLKEIEVETATMKNVIDEEMVLVAMFQYMVGNTDWSVTGMHNIKLFRDPDALQTKAHIVPYDFDYTGVVNATYAVPYEKFNIENVRERLFRSQCYSEELFQQTIDLFISKKKEVMETINGYEYLSSKARQDVAKFIRDFYTQIEAPGAVQYFTRNCGKYL